MLSASSHNLCPIAAIRVYKGQKEGMLGEDAVLSWDKFPHTGNSKVRQLSPVYWTKVLLLNLFSLMHCPDSHRLEKLVTSTRGQ